MEVRTSNRRSRWLVGLTVTGFWLVMTGLLLERHFGGERIAAGAAAPAGPTATWLGVFLDDAKVGYVHLAQTPEERRQLAGTRFSSHARLDLELMGRSTDLELVGILWRPLAAPLADLEVAVRSMGQELRFRGEIAGGELRGEVESGGETVPVRLPVGPDLLMQSGLGSALRFPDLEVGDDLRFDSFDPLTLSRGTSRVRCVARETLELAGEAIETRRLAVRSAGFESVAWIDDAGEVVRAETPLGLTLQRLTAADALAVAQRIGSGEDLLGLTAVVPTGPRPSRGVRAMTVRLGGLDDLALPEGAAQRKVAEATWALRSPEPPASAPPATDADPRHLAADAFVQSRHPAIVERARAIVGDETDPWRQVLALHDWVFTRVDKVPVVSIPSALEVLEHRRGDCNEHTVLFTALARAVGLPTRIAIGLVWSDELGGFYYHAWPEVLVGDGWWATDPTLGQPVADASHLKLLEGGIETWPRLLPYLGKLQIEVLELEP